RGEARARAECFGWGAAVDAFLAAHDAAVPVRSDDATAPARSDVADDTEAATAPSRPGVSRSLA
ncbi:hypothetical protein ACVNF4_29325, partial [Streptomyces sp. S6]